MCVIYAYARSCNNRNAIDDTRPDENAYEYVIYFSLHIRSTKGESKAKEEEKKTNHMFEMFDTGSKIQSQSKAS